MPTKQAYSVFVLGSWIAACAPAGAQAVTNPDDTAQTMETTTAADADAPEAEVSPETTLVSAEPDDAGEAAADEDTAPSAKKPKAKAKGDKSLPKALHRPTSAECGRDRGVGKELESFKLPGLDGKTVTDKSFGDQVLVVNFWGTWCKPCLEELPEFDRLYRHYRKHGVTLLAIATDEEKQSVQDFVRKGKLAAKVAYAGEAYATKYGQSRFPFTFIVDPQGVIRAAYSGFRPECMGKLEADIRTEIERAR